MALNYTNSVPLHFQLKTIIEDKVKNQEYTDRIPSERELMDEFYVSRSTVRQAVNHLVDEGVLKKIPGKGTYVAFKPIQDWLGSLSSTNETVERMGMSPGAKLVEVKRLTLKEALRKRIGLEEVYCFKRIRYANDIPIGIEKNYYPLDIGKKLEKFDLSKEAFYDLLEKHIGIQISEAEQIIKSGNLNQEDAILLGVSSSIGVLMTERRLVDSEENFIEFEEAFYRSDMYEFKMKLSRKN